MKMFFLLIFSLPGIIGIAQQTGRMETDRPDQTESPYITKTKFIQAEIGFNVVKDNGLTTIVHPTVLWKYGVSKRFEIRIITEINSQQTSLLNSQSKKYTTGLLPVKAGGKLSLWEEKGWLPKTSVIGHVAFPAIASKFYMTSKLAPEFRFAMQNTLTNNISLGYNLGAEWDGETNNPAFVYTFGPGFNLGKNGYMYVELFGDITHDASSHNFDAGFAYYTSDNVKLDISSGINLQDGKQYYISLGVSFRVKPF